jgi:hypothetical protein
MNAFNLKLSFLIFNLFIHFINAQCNFSGLSPTYCLNAPQVTLTPSGPGQQFSGNGINGTVFTPSLAGLGNHTISTQCAANYTVANGLYSPINSAGTQIMLSDDDVSSSLPIGFPFTFFCNSYTNFYISSNGFITFSANQPDGCCSGDFLPNFSLPENLIAFAWSDLDPSAGGTITYTTVGSTPNRTLLMNFNGIEHYSGPDLVTTQVQLHETTNLIEIHTTSMTTDGNDHTMGIENVGGSIAFVVSGRNKDNSWSAFNEAKRFTPNNCSYSQTTTVNGPAIVVYGDSVVCSGASSTLLATGAVSYTWSAGAGGAQSSSVVVSPTTTMVYTLSGTDQNGCIGSASREVTVIASPPVSISQPTNPICAGQSTTLSASGAGSYTWSTGANTTSITVSPTSTSVYSLTGLNGNCFSYTSTTVIIAEAPSLTTAISTSLFCSGKTATLTAEGATGYTWTSAPGINTPTPVVVISPPVGNYNYTLTGLGSNGCTAGKTVSFSVVSCVGLNNYHAADFDVQIYPNPNQGSFTITSPKPLKLKLFNELGQMIAVYHAVDSTNLVQIQGLKSGIYFIEADSGTFLIREKIVVVH